MNTETTKTNSHPYEIDVEAYETGKRHGLIGRYSLSAATSPAWVYWYEQGRAETATDL